MGMKTLWEDWGTIWFLEQFGLWANQPAAIQLGYPKRSNFADMQWRSAPEIRIDDDVAGFIHDTINELGVRNEAYKIVLNAFYVRRRTLEKAGQEAGIKRAKAIETLRIAEALVDSKLNDYFKLTEAQRIAYKSLLKDAS